MKLELIEKTSWMRPKFRTLEVVRFEKDYVWEGFETDLASVPRLLWLIVPSIEHKTAPCAVLHDKQCFLAKTWEDRIKADKQFFRFLRARGVSKLKSYLMYAGVRFGAWIWWAKE